MRLFHELGGLTEDRVERAAGLAGAHHADAEAIEDLALRGHGIGQRRAAPHLFQDAAHQLLDRSFSEKLISTVSAWSRASPARSRLANSRIIAIRSWLERRSRRRTSSFKISPSERPPDLVGADRHVTLTAQVIENGNLADCLHLALDDVAGSGNGLEAVKRHRQVSRVTRRTSSREVTPRATRMPSS